jgi:cytohesin
MKELLAAIDRGDAEAAAKALDAGAALSANAPGGDPPLVLAAASGDERIAALLLERGAPVDGAGEAGNTALMHAAARGHLGLVRLLLRRGADPARANRWGLKAEDWAKWPANAAEVLAALQERGRA